MPYSRLEVYPFANATRARLRSSLPCLGVQLVLAICRQKRFPTSLFFHFTQKATPAAIRLQTPFCQCLILDTFALCIYTHLYILVRHIVFLFVFKNFPYFFRHNITVIIMIFCIHMYPVYWRGTSPSGPVSYTHLFRCRWNICVSRYPHVRI